jgi:hypothetical protein
MGAFSAAIAWLIRALHRSFPSFLRAGLFPSAEEIHHLYNSVPRGEQKNCLLQALVIFEKST